MPEPAVQEIEPGVFQIDQHFQGAPGVIASYLLAATKSFPLVGYLMQHKHASTTEKYEGMATEADARLVFAMTPEAVAHEWEDFVAQVEAGALVPDIPNAAPRSV